MILDLTWRLIEGDPIGRSWHLDQTFTRQVVFREAEESELDSDEDSGTDDRPILLTCEVQDRHLRWITNMVNNSEVVGQNLDPMLEKPTFSNYVITMTKKLVCEEGCMDHFLWTVHLENGMEGPKLEDLSSGEGLIMKILRWIKKINASHFRNFKRSSLLEIVLGIQSKNSDRK